MLKNRQLKNPVVIPLTTTPNREGLEPLSRVTEKVYFKCYLIKHSRR